MKKLFVIIGPTAVGKTSISIKLAEILHSPIISADSRQFFKELKIGTAAPTDNELKKVKHYFIGTHSIFDTYNAGQYEEDAIKLLTELFQRHNALVLTGGSMMYIDAVCNGLDNVPTISDEVREFWKKEYETKGLAHIQEKLKELDEKHYTEVDLKNPKRILHALEVCMQSGKPYSDFRKGKKKKRDFEIIKIGLNRPRAELYNRINQRVDIMIKDGLIEEAKRYYSHKELNTLNTVGYKELYGYMDGEYDLEKAIELIKRDSRRYAKRQLTWFNKDEEIHWFHPDKEEEIILFIQQQLN